MIARLFSVMVLFGVDPRKFAGTVGALPRYFRDYRALRRQLKKSASGFPFGKWYPVLNEDSEDSGTASGHYFHQDMLVARRVLEKAPQRHVDIGSRIDGFVAHVGVFREIEVFDIRQLESTVPNIIFRQQDLMQPPDPSFQGYCDSLSCLHALEHFGLGRYGDPVDAAGYAKAFQNMAAMIAPSGTFYLSVPIGPQRIEFNAHRVFSVSHLLSLFDEEFTISRFSYVDDAGDLHENIDLGAADLEHNFDCTYGCGIVEAMKRPSQTVRQDRAGFSQ